MAILTVSPSQNIYNRNYLGSTLYCRQSSVLMRRKHTTIHLPHNKSVFTDHLLKTSAISYKSLSTPNKQSFIDFVALNPEYKSGINVMTKINISKNYSDKFIFIPIESINPESSFPVSPVLSIHSFNYSSNTFSVDWGPEIESGSNIRFFITCTHGAPLSPSVFIPFYSILTAINYSCIIFFPNLRSYDFVNVKATYVSPSGLESPLSILVFLEL